MRRRAYVVVGPESSGNRFMVEVLVRAGCWGMSGHHQPIDGPDYEICLPAEMPERLAFHRSYPHNYRWPDLVEIVRTLREDEYEVTVLVMLRNPVAVEASQVSRGYADSRSARDRIKMAMRDILRSCVTACVEFYVVPYSDLGNSAYVLWLLSQLGLSYVDAGWRNEDAKYFGRTE